jgi:hypothetical protein
MRRTFRLLIVMMATAAATARADIPYLQWEAPEVVDAPVDGLGSPSGTALVFSDATWNLVYLKDGAVVWQSRPDGAGSWSGPETLSPPGVPCRNPHLAWDGAQLHVFWEDDRQGHAEIWTRRWEGSAWSAEECLTCDASPSRQAVAVGHEETATVLLAWTEEQDGNLRVAARVFRAGTWEPPMGVNGGAGPAWEPSVAANPTLAEARVVWTDGRHGDPEIYQRTYVLWNGTWQPEVRVTDMAGSCRHPSIHEANCCGDYVAPGPFIVFENDASGVPEIYGVCSLDGYGLTQYSPGGAPSVGPSPGGFTLVAIYCEAFGGPDPVHFFSWTDSLGPQQRTLVIARRTSGCGNVTGKDTLSVTPLSPAFIAGREGSPQAAIMAAWVEEISGVPTLVARRGLTPGCSDVTLVPPPTLLIAPEGFPADTIWGGDLCTGEPEEYLTVEVDMDAELQAALTWDPEQPAFPLESYTGPDGLAVFPIRGGGCAQVGHSELRCGGIPTWSWPGVKSPDVNGDCKVTDTDVAYVTSMMGTDDFCADLDGNGIVDADDLAIVQATYGDHCSHVTAVGETGPAAPGFWVLSNPARGSLGIRLRLPQAAPVELSLWDVAGRQVASLWRGELEAGEHTLRWGKASELASGVYFLRLRAGSQQASRSVLVLD